MRNAVDRDFVKLMREYLLTLLWGLMELLEGAFSRGTGYPGRLALLLTLGFSVALFDSLLPRFLILMALVLPLLLYLSLPLCYWTCPWFRHQVIYMSCLPGKGPFCDLRDPVKAGLAKARNFYFVTPDGVKLGLWHAWPDTSSNDHRMGTEKDEEFAGDRPVIFMLRGSIGSRGTPWRVEAIKRLTGWQVDAHVITLDYRGFGDSSQVKPTVDTVTKDVLSIYKWLRLEKGVDSGRIFLHGQSLGSAVAMHLAREIEKHRSELGVPAGLILLCPFTSIAEACSSHPLIVNLYNRFPLKGVWLQGPTERDPDITWDSLSRIPLVSSPMLILHAEDDWMIPHSFGKKLYDVGKGSSPRRPIRMISYDARLGYAHNRIFCDPGYPKLIRDFLDEFGQKT